MKYVGTGFGELALDLIGGALLLAIVVIVIVASAFAIRRRRKVADTLLAVVVILAAVLAERSIVAPAESWPLLLAAFEESTDRERLERSNELRNHWAWGEIRVTDWLALSKRWGVCHGMWEQQQCRRPSGPFEAQGVAREILGRISQGRPYPEPAIEWQGVPGRR